MEYFRDDGCLSEEGLRALREGRLEELERLEAAEHLAYCDRCLDRYTAQLTADALEPPPRSVRGPVMQAVWVRVMQNTVGRAAVAGVAAALALTLWRTGALTGLQDAGAQLRVMAPPAFSTPRPEEPQPPGLPGQLYDRLFEALDGLTGSAGQQTEK